MYIVKFTTLFSSVTHYGDKVVLWRRKAKTRKAWTRTTTTTRRRRRGGRRGRRSF